jgi:hypothetical protein
MQRCKLNVALKMAFELLQNKMVAVLEIPPVNSPESAVKVAIASKGKNR